MVLIPKSWWGQLEARLRAFARLGWRPGPWGPWRGLLALVYVGRLPYTPAARFSGLTLRLFWSAVARDRTHGTFATLRLWVLMPLRGKSKRRQAAALQI